MSGLGILPQSVADRFWSKVAKGDGCWLWQGNRNEQGYGRIRVAGKIQRAHRVSYHLANGAIPEGMVICHRCDTPACVRPDHLFAGTLKDNARDCVAKGRFPFHVRYGRGRCKRGHYLTPDNIYVAHTGCRACRICQLRRVASAKAARIARAALSEVSAS